MTLERCRRFNVVGCTVLDCEAVGMRLKDVTDSRVSDCLIRSDLDAEKKVRAFVVEGGRGNLFASNVFGGGADIAASRSGVGDHEPGTGGTPAA